MPRPSPALPLLAALLSTGCLYNSQWGESKRIQQHNAARATPATIKPSQEGTTGEAPADSAPLVPIAHTYRVRAYATPAYEAQTLDWRRRVTDLVEDADRVLAPTVGARLEVESFRDWDASEQDLRAALAALKATDDAHDVNWVVGFVGGLSRATRSFHELGMADVVGKYLVVRATRQIEEEAAIDAAFGELKQEVRAKLAHDRMRHRATAVLLHEVGHTLGAIHARDERDLMHPEYDTHMEAFGAASAALMKARLRHRDEADPKESARALLAVLADEPADAWIAADREPFEARLRAVVEPAPAPTAAEVAAPKGDKPMPPEVAALPAEARTRFAEAVLALDAGDAEGALARAKPLFATQPNVYAVQDLRCKIALARGADWHAECEQLMKLSTGKKWGTKPGKM